MKPKLNKSETIVLDVIRGIKSWDVMYRDRYNDTPLRLKRYNNAIESLKRKGLIVKDEATGLLKEVK